MIGFAGHTPGQIGLWRESDRTVVCADTMRSINLVTGLPQLGEMPELFTSDRAESRRSIRKLAALEANTVCFGHGRPLTKGAAARINEFAAALPVGAPDAPSGRLRQRRPKDLGAYGVQKPSIERVIPRSISPGITRSSAARRGRLTLSRRRRAGKCR